MAVIMVMKDLRVIYVLYLLALAETATMRSTILVITALTSTFRLSWPFQRIRSRRPIEKNSSFCLQNNVYSTNIWCHCDNYNMFDSRHRWLGIKMIFMISTSSIRVSAPESLYRIATIHVHSQEITFRFCTIAHCIVELNNPTRIDTLDEIDMNI